MILALFEVATVKEEKKAVNMSFNKSFVDEVDLRANRLGVSRSTYVRLALIDYFKKEDRDK